VSGPPVCGIVRLSALASRAFKALIAGLSIGRRPADPARSAVADVMQGGAQDKRRELAVFDRHEAPDGYNAFVPESSARLADMAVRLGRFEPGFRIADLGCGAGLFTELLRRRGCDCVGLDLSPKLLSVGRRLYPDLEFVEGDAESLPFGDASFDGVLLGGVIHHLPDPARCIREVHRVLRRGRRFVAFDPNRMNPFMWLYRSRSSPFYSPVGVTVNEQPILAREVAAAFAAAGFSVETDYPVNLRYRYTASPVIRRLLPVYNAVDRLVFAPPFMRRYRSFVMTFGEKT
jgi:SAM-dependent methyltransferase